MEWQIIKFSTVPTSRSRTALSFFLQQKKSPNECPDRGFERYPSRGKYIVLATLGCPEEMRQSIDYENAKAIDPA